MASALDITVYDHEWLLKPYGFVQLIPGVVLLPTQKPTISQVQAIDITGRVVQIRIFDTASSVFAPMVYDSTGANGLNTVIDNAAGGLWHYNLNSSLWTADLIKRTTLQYNLFLLTAGVPKRMWGGKFTVLKS